MTREAGILDLTDVPLAELLALRPDEDDALAHAIRRVVEAAGDPGEAASAFNSAI